MQNDKIAVIGDKDNILAFRALGADAYPIRTYFDAREILKKLARSYSIILITEDIAANLSDLTERYKARAYPIVIPIPTSEGSKGVGRDGIKRDIIKALGKEI